MRSLDGYGGLPARVGCMGRGGDAARYAVTVENGASKVAGDGRNDVYIVWSSIMANDTTPASEAFDHLQSSLLRTRGFLF